MDLLIDGVRLFLAAVLVASASTKRGPAWRARLVGYGLVPRALALGIAPVIPCAEVAVALALVTTTGIGLLAAGATFLTFGVVLAAARHAGYEGACGCSRAGRVSWLAALRAFVWGTLALAIGTSALAAPPPAATLEFLALESVTLVTSGGCLVLLQSIAITRGRDSGDAPRPRSRRIAREEL